MDNIHEECGVFGVYSRDNIDAAKYIYYGLTALQHRGQESCGIAVCDTCGPIGNICAHKDMGLVSEVFEPKTLGKLRGNIGIGHVRYSTSGDSTRENAQPVFINYAKGTVALAHNGNIMCFHRNDILKHYHLTGNTYGKNFFVRQIFVIKTAALAKSVAGQ